MNDPRYPIGKYQGPESITAETRKGWIDDIASMPALLNAAVSGLEGDQLEAPYRDGGWTIRQTVHHLADSHMNSFIRFKLALTEDNPTIKPYEEKLWAELPDSKGDIGVSLALIESMHTRWVWLLQSMSEADYKKTFVHPQSGKPSTLERNLGLYAWHGKHHTAHITNLRSARGW